MKPQRSVVAYLLLCLVATGIALGLMFIGVPVKADPSENLLFFCIGFIIPSAFVMMTQDYTEKR